MSASIRLDELVLLSDDGSDQAADDAQGWHYQVSADGTEWTNAEETITSVQSQLFDGAAVTGGSYENLPATLMVRVVASDSALLAQGTAELVRVLRRPGMRELAYDAPDGASPTTVFDVLKVQPALQYADLDEMENSRTYKLTLTCKPFPRSADEISTPAAALSTPTFTLVDAVSSSSGWSAQTSVWPVVSAQSWTPARYNIVGNGFVEAEGTTSGWSRGGNSDEFRMAVSDPMSALSSASPQFSTSRIFANMDRRALRTTAAHRIRLVMESRFTDAVFGVLYRWYNSAGAQIGSDQTITEVSNSGGGEKTVTALVTPASGSVYMTIHPYARYSSANGKYRDWTMKQVYIGPEGTSFWGSSATVLNGSGVPTTTYDFVGTPNASDSVELVPASMTAASGQVSVAAYMHLRGLRPVLARAGTISPTASSPYIVVTGTVTGLPAASGISDAPSATVLLYGVPGRSWFAPALLSLAANGAFTAYYHVGAATVPVINLAVAGPSGLDAATVTLSVTQVDLATSTPAIGTGRQGKFTFDVEGTMPAEASLTVANAGGIGSNVLIYTAPANGAWVPALSPSLVAAGTTDATSISNKKFTVATSQPSAETWKVSHAGLLPSTYALFARVTATGLTSGTSYTFSTYQHTSPDGGTTWYGENVTSVGKILASGSTLTGAFVQLGTLRLPTVDLNRDPDGVEGLRLWVSGGTWTIDEAWLFDLVNGQLSYLTLPSATYANVTVRAASPDKPQQQYLCHNGDGTIRGFERSVQIWGNHRFDPAAGCDVFAICDAATPALSVSASYYPRWDMYAAPLSSAGTT